MMMKRAAACFFAVIFLSTSVAYGLAPQSEGKKNDFGAMRRVIEAVGTAKDANRDVPTGLVVESVVENTQYALPLRPVQPARPLISRCGGIARSLLGVYGVGIVFTAALFLLNTVSANAFPGLDFLGSDPGAVAVSFLVILGVTTVTVIVAVLIWDMLRPTIPGEPAPALNKEAAKKQLQDNVRDLLNSTEGKPLIELFNSFFIMNINPVAIYERKPTIDGQTAFVLNNEKRGNNADKSLEKHGMTMDDVGNAVKKITARIEEVPNGDLVRQIVISGLDAEHIEMRKLANILVITLPLLRKEALLMEYAIWHECFCHTGPMRDMALEETLAYALTFMHMVNIFRDNQNDPDAVARHNRAMAEITGSEIERTMAAMGRYSKSAAIRDLNAAVVEREAATGKRMESEEILRLAVPLAVRILRENIDIYKQDFKSELYEKNSDKTIVELAIETWNNERETFLRGRPLYAVILPFALCDFSGFMAHSLLIKLASQAVFAGLIMNEMRLVQVFNGITNALSQVPAPKKSDFTILELLSPARDAGLDSSA